MISVSIKAGWKYFMTAFSSYPPEKPRLAFLGPLGTYSHQAAFEFFGDSVEYIAQPTITDVQQTLSTVVPFGIIPQENSTNGSVVETYNVLGVPAVGRETLVRGASIFRVKHSLVTQRGVKLENIEKVLSHEQALGQCRDWLAKHLPHATLVCTDSTAGAAKSLLSTENGLDSMKCAAICSSVVVTIYKGLQILEEGIQDGHDNFTRFYILAYGLDTALPENCPLKTQCTALLRLQVLPGGEPLDVPGALGALDLTVLRIDRRPSFYPIPFRDVYFLEVGVTSEHVPGQAWTRLLQCAVDKVRGMGLEVSILGSW